MKSFTTAKIPDWVRTITKKHKLSDDELFALCQAVEEIEYLHSLDLDGDARHDRKIEALQQKAKELEKFGSGSYRWPKSIATIRYELRAVISNDRVFTESMDRLLAMRRIPREKDYGMIKARKNDEENRIMLHYNGSDE